MAILFSNNVVSVESLKLWILDMESANLDTIERDVYKVVTNCTTGSKIVEFLMWQSDAEQKEKSDKNDNEFYELLERYAHDLAQSEGGSVAVMGYGYSVHIGAKYECTC